MHGYQAKTERSTPQRTGLLQRLEQRSLYLVSLEPTGQILDGIGVPGEVIKELKQSKGLHLEVGQVVGCGLCSFLAGKPSDSSMESLGF